MGINIKTLADGKKVLTINDRPVAEIESLSLTGQTMGNIGNAALEAQKKDARLTARLECLCAATGTDPQEVKDFCVDRDIFLGKVLDILAAGIKFEWIKDFQNIPLYSLHMAAMSHVSRDAVREVMEHFNP